MTVERIAVSAAGRAGIAAVRAVLGPGKGDDTGPVAAQRTSLAAFAAAAPPPAAVTIEAVTLGGVPALRVAPENARGDLLYLHGGAYVLGSATTHSRLGAAFAVAAGATTWIVDYRLAPEDPYPAAVDDALSAWRTLVAGGDAAALIGDSAGGGLALAAALAIRDRALAAPVAVAMTSPWVDLTMTAPSLTTRADAEIMLTPAGLSLDADRYRGGVHAADPRVSPLFADLRGLPPTMIQCGTDEVLVDDATRLHDRLVDAGVRARLQLWEGMTHSWAVYGAAVPEAAASVAALGGFLRDALDGAAR